MKLKRLVVQGFKSFKDRTTIHFDQAITGIVGPNGCGKSNIVDALFWIMGEQSAKHLRGNSMKDVIFIGSQKYAPGAWAEVSLILENDGGKQIHIGNKLSAPSEIQLTRKLYRNGETEYRINDIPCRLRDIQEVFMDTGAGAKSYSIIAQGEISRLVQAKPEERRSMIEDVAGITKFKMRKRESLKKIENTQSNLNRLSDLKAEIEKSLHILDKQAEKAKKARTLKERIERNELIVSSHKEFEHLKALQDLALKANQLRMDQETWSLTKDQIEISLEQERIEKEDLNEQLEQLQSEYNSLSRELATNEEKVNSFKRTVEEKRKQIDEREAELETISNDREQREMRLTELEEEKQELISFSEEDHDYSDLEERVELLKEQLDDKQEHLKELDVSIEEHVQKLRSVTDRIDRNNSKIEEYARDLSDMTQEIESLEKDYSGVSSSVAQERDVVNTLEESITTLETEVFERKNRLDELKEKSFSLDRDLREKQGQQIKTESTLESLKSIRSRGDGAAEGSTQFLESENAQGWQLLSSLVSCNQKYQKALETLVGDALHYLINTEGMNDSQLTSWIAGNDVKGVDYIRLMENSTSHPEALERLKLKGFDDVVELKDLFHSMGDNKALEYLFSGYYISEHLDFNSVEQLSSLSHFRAMVSLDGKVLVKRHGDALQVSLLDDSEGMGAVERNNKILELEESLQELNVVVEKMTGEKEEVEALYMEAQTLYVEKSEALASIKLDFASKKAALDSKLENFEVNSKRLEILQNRKQDISKIRLELLEEDEGLQLEKERYEEELENFKTERDEEKEQVETVRSQYDETKEELLEKQIAAKSFEQQLKSCESQISDVVGQIENHKTRLARNEQLIEEYQLIIEQTEEELNSLEEGNLEQQSDLQDREDVLNIHKDRLAEILVGMQDRENQVKDLGQKINKAEKESVECNYKIQQHTENEALLVREIFESYRIDLRKALLEFLETSENEIPELQDLSAIYIEEVEGETRTLEAQDYTFIRRYGQDLDEAKNKLKYSKIEYSKLGEINWQAIEDYERQQRRYTFLHAQEQELKTSLEDLQTAIDHIDLKSKERFQQAFNEVSSRFEKVFPIIFGGGSAKLEIVGDINDLECGVDIIAQPPGKKMQNINSMSGGEKAMTAVSLIFSIFLVKPSPFCLLDEVDAPLDDANVDRFNELLREMSSESQFILITHNKKTMELNDTLYGVTMQEPGVSKAVSVQLH